MDPLISIVDDDEGSREALAVLTRSFGFVAETYSSPGEFLASPHLAMTACLIADVNMPGMTGVQLHRRLVMLGHAIPTVLITAYPDDAVRARAIADGVIGYVSKPCSDATLLGVVLSALKTVDH
jgi:FixJ family two-component response regulator